jgi:hypothetical protein
LLFLRPRVPRRRESMKRSVLLAVVALISLGVVSATEPTPEPDALLPPLSPWSGASEALIAAQDDPWITPAESSGLTDSPDYETTFAWLRKLVAASPKLKMASLGKSHEGRDLWAIIASKDGAASPAELVAGGRPTLFAQGGIHAGEIDGKDAGMMLLREMTVGGGKSELLDGANLVFVPIFNVDGHERASRWSRANQRGPVRQGWRTSARNLNLNRDYAKLDTPEMQAMVLALNEWPVDLYIDLHVTDGADYQYDVTFGWNLAHAYSPAIAGWLDSVLRPALNRDLEKMGHVPGPLIFQVDKVDPTQGIWSWTGSPRFSNGYGDARHLPTVLVENHSLKPFKRRVLGTYVLLETCMRVVAADAAKLREAVAADRALRRDPVPLGFTNWEKGEVVAPRRSYKAIKAVWESSEISGEPYPRYTGEAYTVEVPVVETTKIPATATRTSAYWIPPTWPEVIERLRLHGVRMETIAEARKVEVEAYRVQDVRLAETAYEGHVRVEESSSRIERRTMLFPAGSVRVATDQPLGDLAILLLEPDSQDSFYRWGFFLEIFSRTEYVERYVLEPLAQQMLDQDPQLRRKFEARLKSDEEFRGDAEARLRWFYERTPYYDQRYLLYPVAREPVAAK